MLLKVAKYKNLFPLDSRWWLGRYVVDDTVNVVHFVNDTNGDFLEHVPRDTGFRVLVENLATPSIVNNRVNYYSIIALFSYINCSW
jgi:hypothetical protein